MASRWPWGVGVIQELTPHSPQAEALAPYPAGWGGGQLSEALEAQDWWPEQRQAGKERAAAPPFLADPSWSHVHSCFASCWQPWAGPSGSADPGLQTAVCISNWDAGRQVRCLVPPSPGNRLVRWYEGFCSATILGAWLSDRDSPSVSPVDFAVLAPGWARALVVQHWPCHVAALLEFSPVGPRAAPQCVARAGEGQLDTGWDRPVRRPEGLTTGDSHPSCPSDGLEAGIPRAWPWVQVPAQPQTSRPPCVPAGPGTGLSWPAETGWRP